MHGAFTIGKERPATLFRVIAPLYAHMPKSGMGAARQGGRFNRPGQEALYLSVDQATALAEYQQDNPWLSPGTICSLFVRNLIVADLASFLDVASERYRRVSDVVFNDLQYAITLAMCSLRLKPRACITLRWQSSPINSVRPLAHG